jgi:hypothetical protein
MTSSQRSVNTSPAPRALPAQHLLLHSRQRQRSGRSEVDCPVRVLLVGKILLLFDGLKYARVRSAAFLIQPTQHFSAKQKYTLLLRPTRLGLAFSIAVVLRCNTLAASPGSRPITICGTRDRQAVT